VLPSTARSMASGQQPAAFRGRLGGFNAAVMAGVGEHRFGMVVVHVQAILALTCEE